ncbi:MAG: phosphoribosylformylglycinamidine synthase subunit PurS [Clostridia bacterium]|nr:phosphoribosylformylglycinamidine synthase subunit PurS [Deltaproteobacteria bacterium]
MPIFKVELIVKPRPGVRDPQGEAVEGALHGIEATAVKVHHVGRYLAMDVTAASADEARKVIDDLCKRLLVNPNLETYTAQVGSA